MTLQVARRPQARDAAARRHHALHSSSSKALQVATTSQIAVTPARPSATHAECKERRERERQERAEGWRRRQEQEIVYLGEVDRALQFYDKSLAYDSGGRVTLDDKPRPFNRDPRVRLMAINVADTGVATLGEPLRFELEVEVFAPLSLVFGIGFCSKSGSRVLTSNSDYSRNAPFSLSVGKHVISCTFPDLPLAPGEYLLDIGCCSDGFVMYDEIKEACLVEVLPPKEAPAYLLHKFSTCMTAAVWQRIG